MASCTVLVVEHIVQCTVTFVLQDPREHFSCAHFLLHMCILPKLRAAVPPPTIWAVNIQSEKWYEKIGIQPEKTGGNGQCTREGSRIDKRERPFRNFPRLSEEKKKPSFGEGRDFENRNFGLKVLCRNRRYRCALDDDISPT